MRGYRLLRVAKYFLMSGVDVSVGVDVAFEKALGVVGDDGLGEFDLFDILEIVLPVHAPAAENADVESVCRTEE